jgi:Rieske Fe-S protein
MTHGSTRRTVLATGAAALAATGCGTTASGTDNSTDTSPSAETAPPAQAEGSPSSPHSADASLGAAEAAQELTSTGDIPEGGGKVFAEQKVVVTQPVKGQFKAFSAICTHQGCTVTGVAQGTIDCACHGSRFRITDGSVADGPATQPLAARQITVKGNSIRLT